MTHPIDPEHPGLFPDPDRKTTVIAVRDAATHLSTDNPFDKHKANRDQKPPHIFNFTKGLAHKSNGLLEDVAHYDAFVAGTNCHDPEPFADVPAFREEFTTENKDHLREPDNIYRQWESPTAGHAYELQGPDSFAITMPPAPEAGSHEFAAEMAEVYEMALLREVPIASFMTRDLIDTVRNVDGTAVSNACRNRLIAGNRTVNERAQRLSGMRWFQGKANGKDTRDVHERARRRFGQALEPTKGVGPSTLFRGIGEDPWDTPFLSQFMVMGTSLANACHLPDRPKERSSAFIAYGNQRIPQGVRIAKPNKDYMTTWIDYLEVQNGLNKRAFVNDCRGEEFVGNEYRNMARLRDMATYVHDDALYQAYLNAALILLREGFALDAGIPYHNKSANPLSQDNREPFALFGGPHLLTLVTEVSSRALKAVRLQKFTVHRRLRPEAAGALFHTIYTGYHPDRLTPHTDAFPDTGTSDEAKARKELGGTLARYTFPQGHGSDPVLEQILEDVRLHNAEKNGDDPADTGQATWLLPMAFPEGSPMHPAYGAGHATVAGACVTLLKAFFAMTEREGMGDETPVYLVRGDELALVPDGGVNPDDLTIDLLGVSVPEGLTLESELNKLMWNISNARNIAGVHYYTDYVESALLGEAITIGILREQMLTYHPKEKVEMTVPLLVPRTLPESLLNGSTIDKDEVVSAVLIRSDGTLKSVPPTPR
ncbi:MAG: bromoperoxidase [Pseudomonadota bacterium]